MKCRKSRNQSKQRHLDVRRGLFMHSTYLQLTAYHKQISHLMTWLTPRITRRSKGRVEWWFE
ncbi:hypothetical protein OO013_14565 [Mangrovivirga sp. M17]|uniref:Uncharacterized protein n=1 Tax=Mangrovivirga halotolerans TaxID=2993936 RepID=A0ABT3RTJ4_9BACT|nr:hypothetical protein [Mangrovivirga halotolerans]MCX2745100.1 hypothetical protein [Mangrovivirga halotolerans]